MLSLLSCVGMTSGPHDDIKKIGPVEWGDFPLGEYFRQSDEKQNVTGYNSYLILKKNPNRKVRIDATGHSLKMRCSPSDKFFAVLDYIDEHTVNIYIYVTNVWPTPPDYPDELLTIVIYRNPPAKVNIFEGRRVIDYCFWDVASWDIPHGKVKIECQYGIQKDKLNRATYDIPLFLVNDTENTKSNKKE